MTQEEILQYNKRCAEFLGWDYNKLMDRWNEDMLHEHCFVESIELKFHSDWNWIMEVVEAIEKLGETSTRYGTLVDITTTHMQIGKIVVDLKLNPMNKKEAVVLAINQFLIWYEQNKTT